MLGSLLYYVLDNASDNAFDIFNNALGYLLDSVIDNTIDTLVGNVFDNEIE